jgi:aminopeptidase N
MSGRDITLKIFVEAHDIDKCSHAVQSLKNSMRWAKGPVSSAN